MGGRGNSSGMEKQTKVFTDSVLTFMKKNENIYGTMTGKREQYIREEVNYEYKMGFSGMKDGRLIDMKGSQYAIKEGDEVVVYKFIPDGHQAYVTVNDEGIVYGRKGKEVKRVTLNKAQEELYLRRAILLRLRPRQW